MGTGPSASKTALLTSLALVAFAANSLLCRAALGARAIDAATFTLVRIGIGALTLAVIARLRGGSAKREADLASPAALFAYAIAFSIAYLRLPTGTGALVLFGAVQITMIAAGVRAGERPRPSVWAAMSVALGGLVVLTLPGLGAPDPIGAVLMSCAGIAWGVYSLRGRGSADPLGTTARNFARSVPLAAAGFLVALAFGVHAEPRGLIIAAASGALASGIGYTIWYTALRGLTASRAAVAQLAVPVIAAAAGVALLGEQITSRLVLSTIMILGGVAFVLARR